MSLRTAAEPLRTALAFLTRLVPAKAVEPPDLAASMAAFPLVGLVLGVAGLLPVLALAEHPWLAAWVWVVAQLWLTRGLHQDGLADVADAWGSGARGERFLEILKDSRVGAFGVMGLFLGMSGQLLLVRELVELQAWGGLVGCAVWGRAACVALAWLGRGSARQGLGGLFLRSLRASHAAWACAWGLGLQLLLAGPGALAAALALTAPVVWGLAKLGRERGGLGGDFLGTCILAAELLAGLGWILAQ